MMLIILAYKDDPQGIEWFKARYGISASNRVNWLAWSGKRRIDYSRVIVNY